jgi:Na+/melibiose symporter-like transporter
MLRANLYFEVPGSEMSITEQHIGLYLMLGVIGIIICCVVILQLMENYEKSRPQTEEGQDAKN